MSARYRVSHKKNDINVGTIKSSRFVYDIGSGEASTTNTYLIKKIIAFIVLWNSILFLHIRAVFTGKESRKLVALVYRVRIEKGIHPKFVDFCKYGPIASALKYINVRDIVISLRKS